MCLFKKKKEADKVKDNRELISSNARALDGLLVIANKNESLSKEIRSLQEKIKYLVPSEDSKVTEFDKKIKNLIEDLRIVLIKADDDQIPQKANSLLTQIKLNITDRNSKI